MKIFIAGATGVLGRRLIQQFRERGHGVVGMARSAKNEATIRSLGGESRAADLFDAESLTRAADGADVVIHAATAIPTGAKPRPEDWKLNDRIRRDGTRALGRAAAKVGAKQFLVQSITWVARPVDQSAFDESSPLRPDPNIQSAADMETMAREDGATYGFGVAILRCSWFHSADSGALASIRAAIDSGQATDHWKRRRGLVIRSFGRRCKRVRGGSGSWAQRIVARDGRSAGDFGRIFAKSCAANWRRRNRGAFPDGSRESSLEKQLWISWHRRRGRRTRGFRRDFNWKPRYPSYREALDQIVGEWRRENFLGLGSKIAA